MKKAILLHIVLCFLTLYTTYSQNSLIPPNVQARLDSLDDRAHYLDSQIKRLKDRRDPALYSTQRDLELTYFKKNYEMFLVNEELEAARTLIESRLEKSRLKKNAYLIDFYGDYKDKIYMEIKLQRMRYQALFEKEKNFKKHFYVYIEQETPEAYAMALHITKLALKFAHEQNLEKTIEYLKNYESYAGALIFDHESPYDLKLLTRNASDFMEEFLPLLSSDSLAMIEEAGKLVDHCYGYAANTKSLLDTLFFSRQKIAVSTALNDYFDKNGISGELARLTDKAIVVQLDSINPIGVFKWKEYIVVIDTITPTSSFESVRRGEAILKADRVLSRYIYLNELGKLRDGDKLGHTFFIPFVISGQKHAFNFDALQSTYQFMVCYTLVVNEYFTQEISKYMPPMRLEDEEEIEVAEMN